MGIYDDNASSYNQVIKDGLRRISGSITNGWRSQPGDYAFDPNLKEKNVSWFRNNFGKAADWALHHLIPQQFIRGRGPVAVALRDLTAIGLFSMRDGVKNGLWLPNNQLIADAGGAAAMRPRAFGVAEPRSGAAGLSPIA